MVRLNRRRRRSPKAATRCRACARRRSNATISPRRSGRWATSSRPTRAPSSRPHSVSRSRARRAICIRSFATRSTRLRRKPCAMRSGTRRPGASRSKSATTASSSGCGCATMAKGSIERCSPDQGLEGHYGLRGMPERAALIGGTLAVWSEAGAGTEVELRLPASTVYATSPRRSWWSRLLAPKTPANVRGDAS